MDHIELGKLARDRSRREEFKDAVPYMKWYDGIDFRKNPELYRIGRGEQGVLMAQPYSSEIVPHWKFRTPEIATESAKKIYRMFLAYMANDDFVGADMARKFLQMGWTRSRRYANHPSGRKYYKGTRDIIPIAEDNQTSPMAESARIFKAAYEKARTDPDYLAMKKEFQKKTRP